jgi:hypothetical protein
MAAIANLTEAARRRVVEYALQRLSEERPDDLHFEHQPRTRIDIESLRAHFTWFLTRLR